MTDQPPPATERRREGQNRLLDPSVNYGDAGKPHPPSGKELLRNRAAGFRYAADQIDRLLGMTPAELTVEQEQALLFLAQNTQFVF